jgi:WD40 repeat protein
VGWVWFWVFPSCVCVCVCVSLSLSLSLAGMEISTCTTTKCRLNTSIQSSFGVPDDPDYVFGIAPNGDNSAMAVSLSTNVIKLYAPSTGQFLGDCLGHSTTISEIAYPDASAPYFLCSSSADGTVRAWDTRVRKQVAMLMAPLSQELWSFSLGGGSGNVVAAGANAQVTSLL